MNVRTDIFNGRKSIISSDISEFMSMCDELDSLMISMFHIEEQKFVYYSKSVVDILGYGSDMLTRGGWDTWYTFLKPSECPVIRQKLSEFIFAKPNTKRNGYMAVEYHVRNLGKEWVYIRHEISLRKFAGDTIALSYMHDYTEKIKIRNFLSSSEAKWNIFESSGPDINVTDRELQVLKLIACGLSSGQIAKKLYISRHTVISHRKNLIEKFKVKNTAELVKEASKVIVL